MSEVERYEAPAENAAASLIQVITRAAANPAVDVDKMQKLLDMHERITATAAEAQFNAAFAELQSELPTITKEGKIKNRAGEIQSRYANFEDIHSHVMPLLGARGFALMFLYDSNRGPTVGVAAVLMHKGGHKVTTPYLDLPRDKSGSKNDTQSVGSSLSYGKRYVMCGLLNINTEGEDTGGAMPDDDDPRERATEPQRRAGGNPNAKATQKQLDLVIIKLQRAGCPQSELCGAFEIGAVDDLRFDDVNAALQWIADWKAPE